MKISKEDENLLDDCIKQWGVDDQINQAVEECAEFIAAINKHRRGRLSIKDVCSEIADVMLMMEQLLRIFPKEVIEDELDFKINRLKNRIEEYKKKMR